jgi:ABC-type uncharacterized transport system substrate-binding protein
MLAANLQLPRRHSIERAAQQRVEAGEATALAPWPWSLAASERKCIADLALKHRLPTVVGGREYAEAGGLFSYAVSYPDLFRRAALYVDDILKAAKPGDLPVEQPTRFELVINRATRES